MKKKSRIALTLRTLGGLTTQEIATAFLDKTEAMAARLTRAKKKIAAAGIPYRIPDAADLPERLSSVLGVIYLIFNEGYAPHSGDMPTRISLSDEAIRLARMLRSLMPDEPEIGGLLALMLLHDSRRLTRMDDDGNMVALEHQNRARWDQTRIAEGAALLEDVLPKGRIGAYQLQAAISAVHAQAKDWAATDWPQIHALYRLLAEISPTAVVKVNWAVAASHAVSVEAGLAMLDVVNEDGALERYQPYFAARADLLARSNRVNDALSCYEKAIALSSNASEKRFLERKRDATAQGRTN
ncbi:MAG: hypothetical protein OXR62_06010 [Ahrensia sp.]|nr:hypothetical protein [Ahrensia sp.]